MKSVKKSAPSTSSKPSSSDGAFNNIVKMLLDVQRDQKAGKKPTYSRLPAQEPKPEYAYDNPYVNAARRDPRKIFPGPPPQDAQNDLDWKDYLDWSASYGTLQQADIPDTPYSPESRPPRSFDVDAPSQRRNRYIDLAKQMGGRYPGTPPINGADEEWREYEAWARGQGAQPGKWSIPAQYGQVPPQTGYGSTGSPPATDLFRNQVQRNEEKDALGQYINPKEVLGEAPPPAGPMPAGFDPTAAKAKLDSAGKPPNWEPPVGPKDLPFILLGLLAIKAFGGNNRDLAGFMQGYMGFKGTMAEGKYNSAVKKAEFDRSNALEGLKMEESAKTRELDLWKYKDDKFEDFKKSLTEIKKFNLTVGMKRDELRLAGENKDADKLTADNERTNSKKADDLIKAMNAIESDKIDKTDVSILISNLRTPRYKMTENDELIYTGVMAAERIDTQLKVVKLAKDRMKNELLPDQLILDYADALVKHESNIIDYAQKVFNYRNANKILQAKLLGAHIRFLDFTGRDKERSGSLTEQERLALEASVHTWEGTKRRLEDSSEKTAAEAAKLRQEADEYKAAWYRSEDATWKRVGGVSAKTRWEIKDKAAKAAEKRADSLKKELDTHVSNPPKALDLNKYKFDGSSALSGDIGGGGGGDDGYRPVGTASVFSKDSSEWTDDDLATAESLMGTGLSKEDKDLLSKKIAKYKSKTAAGSKAGKFKD